MGGRTEDGRLPRVLRPQRRSRAVNVYLSSKGLPHA